MVHYYYHGTVLLKRQYDSGMDGCLVDGIDLQVEKKTEDKSGEPQDSSNDGEPLPPI
jgi:hypothetical protein